MDTGPPYLYNIPVLTPGRYFSPLPAGPLPEPRGLHLEVLGFHVLEQTVQHQPAGFPSWRLMFFHQPTAVEVGGRPLGCSAPAAYLFPPGVQTRYGTHGSPWTHSWFRFSGYIRAVVDKDWYHRPGPKTCSAEFWDTWASLIHQECFGTKAGAMASFRPLLQVLLASLRPVGALDPVPEGLRRARHHIDSHWKERYTLGDLAELAGLSPRHFCTRFRTFYGRSPLAYQAHLRVRHACEALSETNLTVAAVAEACGWQDVFHFSKQFRHIQGVSPRQWRRQALGGSGPAGA